MASELQIRKQSEARARIVEVANQLFADRGYDAVSVTDIAAAAGVGRTSFFRYFGDKQEVVFANEQGLLSMLDGIPLPVDAAHDDWLTALDWARRACLRLLEELVRDATGFQQYLAIVETHPDLQGRAAAKVRRMADAISDRLTTAGFAPQVAVLAGNVAAAVYETAQTAAHDDPTTIPAAACAAYDLLTSTVLHPAGP